jgi:RNA-directed DNA polymerase
VTHNERQFICQRLLSHLGTVRHISGAASETGRKASDQMNSLRQKRDKMQKNAEEAWRKESEVRSKCVTADASDSPF